MGAVAFKDLITFTRASGGGRFNAQGQYEWLPANTPRIGYDPVTGECRGLLVEEQRTNLLTYSSDFTYAAWIKGGSVVEAGVGLAPDGSAAATKLVESTANSAHRLTRNVYGANGAYSLSLRVRPAGRTRMRLYLSDNVSSVCFAHFDLTTGQVFSTEFGAKWTGGAASIKPIGGGWFECALSATSTDTTSAGKQLVIDLYDGTPYQGDGTSGIYIWGAQLETGSSPSSYIPTTDAQVTRAADTPSVNVLSPWFNSLEGTLFVEASTRNTRYATIAQLTDGTANNELRLIGWNDTSNRLAVAASGSALTPTLNGLSPWVPRDGSSIKVAAAWGASEFVYAGNGDAPRVQSSSLQPVGLNRLNLGYSSVGGFRLNGHIRSIRYFPRRLSDSELQAMTA